MTDMELMQSAGLYLKDYLTGTTGFTLAAALLLGKDEVIHSVLPAYKTDAILRIQNLDRFDDRDDIRTNLIESYDRLMAFVGKHLPDGFYQEPDANRRSLRSVIFHEVIVNMLGHREFTNPYPAKFIIEKDKVRTENWCKPHSYGLINPRDFTPQTKNPAIAKFFREIGRFEELVSGVRNIFKYTQFYSKGKQPELYENDLFKMVIPIPNFISHYSGGLSGELNGGLSVGLNKELSEDTILVFELIKKNPEIQLKRIVEELNKPTRTTERHIQLLIEKEYIERIGSKKTGGYLVRQEISQTKSGGLNEEFFVNSGGLGGELNGGLNKQLSEDVLLVLEFIKNNPEIQLKRIVVELNKSERTVERYVQFLIEKGYIERIGSKKAGGYMVKPF